MADEHLPGRNRGRSAAPASAVGPGRADLEDHVGGERSSRLATIFAPLSTYSRSGKPAASPAPLWTRTSRPALVSEGTVSGDQGHTSLAGKRFSGHCNYHNLPKQRRLAGISTARWDGLSHSLRRLKIPPCCRLVIGRHCWLYVAPSPLGEGRGEKKFDRACCSNSRIQPAPPHPNPLPEGEGTATASSAKLRENFRTLPWRALSASR